METIQQQKKQKAYTTKNKHTSHQTKPKKNETNTKLTKTTNSTAKNKNTQHEYKIIIYVFLKEDNNTKTHTKNK